MRLEKLAPTALACCVTLGPALAAHAADKPPDVVVIFGDDIGMWNVGTLRHEPGAAVVDGANA
jgi:hypothetical protein